MHPSLTSAKAGAEPDAPRMRRRRPALENNPRASPITRPEYRLGKPPANAGQTYPAEVYVASEILALLDALPKRGRHWRTGVRDRALYTLLWRSGLRIAEALDVTVKDLDLERGILHVMRGKYLKRRAVTIDRRAGEIVAEWLQVRGDLLEARGCDPEKASRTAGPLFCVLNGRTVGRQMADSVVRESMKYWARQAAWTRRAHPHGFRHTFATELYYVEGAELADLQRALGHAHASTTDRYIHSKVPSPRLHRLMRDREWPDERGSHAPSPPRAA